MRYVDEAKLENLTDEEIDELYRPRKTNDRKKLAPIFVYEILKERTNEDNHLSQKQILNILEEGPYEIILERKTLGRVLNLLGDQYDEIVVSTKYGYWYQKE